MESFIRYLYEYKNEQRIRNVGFVKVDRDESGGALQIHGRGTFLNNADISVYLIYMEGKRCFGIPMGELRNVQSIISCRLVYENAEIEKYISPEKLRGIILNAAGQGIYAAVWDEMPIPIDRMEIPGEPDRESDEECAEESAEDAENVSASEETVVEAAQSGSCRKIDRSDMAKLPRKSRYFANNSFLLHGYYNYHHLLLAEKEGETYLGVPGVYHRREAAAAQSFGFPEFYRIPDGTLELSAQECDSDPAFGYWCRKIEKE